MNRQQSVIEALAHRPALMAPSDVLASKRSLAVRGIYAWYGRSAPGDTDTSECHHYDGRVLLYVGIAPVTDIRPNGTRATRTMFDRLKAELLGYAHQSPVRKSVGCLLKVTPYFKPNDRKPFVFDWHGDELVNLWLRDNVKIVGVPENEPWKYEQGAIEALKPLLNRTHNDGHPYFKEMSSHLEDFRFRAVAIDGPTQQHRHRRSTLCSA